VNPRFEEERALPQIWDEGFHPERIDWYTNLVVEAELIRGGVDVIPEFIAAMIMESGLDNLKIGNNAKHGNNNPWLGISWCQLDTGYHVADLEQLHTFRSDPILPLIYVATNPDLCDQGGTQTHFNEQRWHAWEPKTIDPQEEWNPLQAAHESWERTQT